MKNIYRNRIRAERGSSTKIIEHVVCFWNFWKKLYCFLKKNQESHPFPEKTKTFQDYHSQKLFFKQKQRFYLSYFYLIVNINMVLKNLLLKNDT